MAMPSSPLPDPLRERLQTLAPVRLAAVFGSTARGEARGGSDVDLALILEPDSPRNRREVEAELARAAGREVDFVYLESAPPLLRFEIARDGVLLLERRPHDWSDFRARAMIDWWDWAPTARLIETELIRRLREKTAGGPT
jgi:predicted nucleotidyltransferase